MVDIGGDRQRCTWSARARALPPSCSFQGSGNAPKHGTKRSIPSEQAVLPAIAETNRVCANDRPGTCLPTVGEEDFETSRSDSGASAYYARMTRSRISHALLDASGERGPLRSWSGIRSEARSPGTTRVNTLRMSRDSSSSITPLRDAQRADR